MEYVSMILNALLGGGLIITLVTLRPARQKAFAEAKASDLDNLQEIIDLWKNTVEDVKKELIETRVQLTETRKEAEDSNAKMQKEIASLRREVSRLTTVNNRMVKLLDKITPENLETMVEQIKQIHNEA